jgi:putative membrane protein
MTNTENEICSAKFNTLIRPYLVINIGVSLAFSIIGLPLAIVWFCGLGQWWARHYFEKLECQLGQKDLRYRKGILFQVEKTIPLENIQDVTFIEGPLLRYFNLSTLRFETAGKGEQSSMHLTGIIDAHNFRNKILELRDRLKRELQNPYQNQLQEANVANNDLAAKQLLALQTIQERLDTIIELLKNNK